MKSSACKSVLDKVSKFEKKYAKVLPKSKHKEESQFKHDKYSDFSESLEDQIKVLKPELIISGSEMRSSPKHESPNDLLMSDISNFTSPIRSSQRSVTKGVGKLTLISKNNVKINSVENRNKIISFSRQSDSDSTSCNVDNTFLTKEKKNDILDKEKNKSTLKEFDRDVLIYDTHLKDLVLREDESIASENLRIPVKVEEANEKEESIRLRMSLNLKLYEDPEEVTDISCKDTASVSLENSNVSENISPHISTVEESITEVQSEDKEVNKKRSSDDCSENVQLRIFTFEDLIALEESKPIDDEIMNNLKDKRTLDEQYVIESESHSQINSSQRFEDENEERNLLNQSNGEYTEEILTNKGSVDETSITEDIEVENSVNENTNQFSEQIQSCSKDIQHYAEIEAIQKILKIESNISANKNISDSSEEKEEKNTFSPENEKNEVHHNVKHSNRKLIKYKEYNREKKIVKEERSNKNLKLFENQDCNVTQSDAKLIKSMKKKHCKEKLGKKIKILEKSKIVSQTGQLCQASTQTDNFVLSENYEFEKRMDSIMKSSFNSMTDITNFEYKMNDIFKDHMCLADTSAAPSWIPLERGFHCALKQQVELTKSFISAEYNMYALCMTAIKEMSATYKPATIHYFNKTKKETYE